MSLVILSRHRGPTLDTTSKYPEDSPTLPRPSRLGRRKLTGTPIIFLDNTLALVEFHDRLALGVQELQWNWRESFLGLVLRLPHLLVKASQLHVGFVDNPLIIRCKASFSGTSS